MLRPRDKAAIELFPGLFCEDSFRDPQPGWRQDTVSEDWHLKGAPRAARHLPVFREQAGAGTDCVTSLRDNHSRCVAFPVRTPKCSFLSSAGSPQARWARHPPQRMLGNRFMATGRPLTFDYVSFMLQKEAKADTAVECSCSRHLSFLIFKCVCALVSTDGYLWNADRHLWSTEEAFDPLELVCWMVLGD